MKQKLAASVLMLSVVTLNRDLLQQLQVLLARLIEQLKAQSIQIQPRPASMITSTPATILLPEILLITPSRGPVGTTITIRGRGFTPTGNTIYASYGVLPDLPSADGRTIILRVEPPGLPPNLGTVKTPDFPELRYRFYVKNVNGATIAPGEFGLDL